MNILVINCGSSSIKYQIMDMHNSSKLASGLLERIGETESRLRHSWLNTEKKYDEVVETRHIPDHRKGFDWIVDVNARTSPGGERKLFGIGHRVVHGGEV
jgi:acetate kinase